MTVEGHTHTQLDGVEEKLIDEIIHLSDDDERFVGIDRDGNKRFSAIYIDRDITVTVPLNSRELVITLVD